MDLEFSDPLPCPISMVVQKEFACEMEISHEGKVQVRNYKKTKNSAEELNIYFQLSYLE